MKTRFKLRVQISENSDYSAPLEDRTIVIEDDYDNNRRRYAATNGVNWTQDSTEAILLYHRTDSVDPEVEFSYDVPTVVGSTVTLYVPNGTFFLLFQDTIDASGGFGINATAVSVSCDIFSFGD